MEFKRFIIYRILTMLVVVFILLTFVFFAVHIIPGDPVQAMLGENAPPEYVQRVREDLGLNQPLYIQYFDYLAGVFVGNFGQSIVLETPVATLMWNSIGVTIQLAAIAWIISVFAGILIGRYSARESGKIQDHTIRTITLFLYAVPVYVLGIIAQIIFGVYLGVLPIFGTISARFRIPQVTGLILLDTILVGNFPAFIDALTHFLLPSLVLSASYMAVSIRLTRGETIKAMKRTFCLLAQAKGLDRKAIVVKHAFRNAILPVVTLIGMQAGSLLTGSVLIETVFSMRGLGYLLYTAASARDYILIQGVVTMFVLITSIIGLLIDISYYFLDPRVRY
jgi:peptide/nickel transport system permease protein